MRTTILGFLAAALLALSSGAAFGADKQFTLKVYPTASPPVGAVPTALTAEFENKGNSSFNALTLPLPASYSFAAGATVTASRGNASFVAGGIKVENINLPTGSGQQMYVYLTGVTVTGACGVAVPGSWTAVPWTGSSVGSGNTFQQVGPTPSTSLTPSCVTVAATSTDTSKGTINAPASKQVPTNTSTTFGLTPAAHYHPATVTGNTCTGTLSGNTLTTSTLAVSCNLSVTFAIDQFLVTPSPGSNGSMSPSTPQLVDWNATQAFTVTANTGYHVDTATGCGGALSNNTLQSATYTTAPVSAACTVSASFAANQLIIATPPKATFNDPFTVTVNRNGVVGPITLTSDCGFTGATTTTGTGSSVDFTGTVPNAGTCTFTAKSTPAADYPTATSTPMPVISGTVGCTSNNYVKNNGAIDPNNTYIDLNLVSPKDWGVRRGPNQTGSDPCVDVDVNMTFPDAWTSHFTYTLPTSQLGNFKYSVVWGEVSVDSSTSNSTDANGYSTESFTTKRPRLAWVELASGAPAWVPALACVDDDLTLVGGLLPVIPNVEPFKGTSGTPSNADFYVGDTPAAAAAKAAKYLNGATAKMCVAQHGWMSTQKVAGIIKVIYWSKIVDQADGWAGIEQ